MNLDINNVSGSFLPIFDRYCISMRWVMIFSAIGVVANLWRGNKAVAMEFALAAVLSLLFQLVLMYFYEMYVQTKYSAVVTNGNYTEMKQAWVQLLAVLSVVFFVIATIAMIVAW